MLSTSIQRKLTILLMVLLIPTAALVYFGERYFDQQRRIIETSNVALNAISEIWSIAEQVNGVEVDTTTKPAGFDQLGLDAVHADPEFLEKTSAEWLKLNDETLGSTKRLSSAHMLITEITQISRLGAYTSQFSPDYSVIMLVQLPEVYHRLETLARLGERLHARETLGQPDAMAFMVNAGQFKAVADSISRVTRSPLSGEATALVAEVSAQGELFRKGNGKFQGAAVKAVRTMEKNRIGPEMEIAPLIEAEKNLDAAISSLWRANERTFRNWLQSEYASTYQSYVATIGGLGAFLVAILTAAWFLRRSILGQAKQLEVALVRTDEQNTALKEREQELELARQNAVAAEMAKSEFLANMSHEIRTPMNGVMGMAELLSRTEMTSKQKMFTDVIVKSGTSLLTIINDILDFSKLDAGQMTLDPTPFDLVESVEDVVALVSTRVSGKPVELIARVDPKIPPQLIGDVGRIRQIVTNLLGNAAKFTEEGHVYINVNGIRSSGPGRQALRFEIIDSGIGIPQEKLSTIFDKFSQVDGSANRKHDGTGLGLSISHSLVELMNGNMGVNSQEGVGSTFWFEIELPIDEQYETPLPPRDLAGKRILVVNQNPIIRDILVEQMQLLEFEAVGVENAAQTMHMLNGAHQAGISVDCIMISCTLPDISGEELAVKIKADPRFQSVPVTMLCAIDESSRADELLSIGVVDHLLQPARSRDIREMVTGALRNNRPVEQASPRSFAAG